MKKKVETVEQGADGYMFIVRSEQPVGFPSAGSCNPEPEELKKWASARPLRGQIGMQRKHRRGKRR